MIDRLLVRRWGLLHSGRLGHVPHEVRFGLGADELHGIIDDDLRHGVHVVSFRQVGKFAGFNDIGPHLGLSIARNAASLAARGQCGQVGVTNTCTWMSCDRRVRISRVCGAMAVDPCDTAMMRSSSVANSYPAGMP